MNLPESNSRSDGNPLHQAYLLASVLAITALTYAGTLRFAFVSDDDLQIADNQFIKSWRYLPRLFVTSVWSHLAPNSPHNYYRPMYLFWNLVNYSLFGLNPAGWHAAAVLLHLVVTALVFLLIRKLLPGRIHVALLTALIFGVHPIHHEVVAWISGATESLYAAFFIGAFLAYCKSRDERRVTWTLVSCALYGLALLSKETAIVLPALIFACAWLAAAPSSPEQAESSRPVPRLARAAVAALVYVPVAAIYLVMRFRVLSSFSHPRIIMSVSALLFTWPSVLAFYLQHWFLPFRYRGYYDMAYYPALDFRGVVLPALALLAFASALWFARRRLGVRETGYAVAWMLFPLLPVLDIVVFPLRELAHDRYFYVPSVGAALLLALLLESLFAGRAAESTPRLWGQPKRLVAAALLLTAVLSFSAAMAASQWIDNLTLYTLGLQTAPLNPVARDGLAAEWIALGHFDQAQALLEPVVQEDPGDWTGWLNLARVRYQKQNYTEAEADLRRTVALNPDSAVAYVLLGQVQLRRNDTPAALASIHQGVQLLPDEFRFRIIYGAVLKASGDCTEAVTQFQAALALQPGNAFAKLGIDSCRAAAKPSSVSSAAPVPQ